MADFRQWLKGCVPKRAAGVGRAAALTLGIALGLAPLPARAGNYTILLMGRFPAAPPGISSTADAINASGQVTGQGRISDGANAYLNDITGTHDLGVLEPHGYSEGLGINDSGQVVGWTEVNEAPGPPHHAFLYSGGVMTDLGTFGGVYSQAEAINNAGQVVGLAQVRDDLPLVDPLTNGPRHAFLYDSTGLHDLSTLGQGESDAHAINNAGQVVGFANIGIRSSGVVHAFLYENGVMTDLNSRLPAGSGWVLWDAAAINDAGQIAGEGQLNGQPRAFFLDGSTVRDLGTLDGGVPTVTGMSAAGDVVGWVTGAQPPLVRRAFLYSNGVMTDLNSLLPAGSGWELVQAKGINAAGQIVGLGNLNHQQAGFLLTPGVDPRGVAPAAPTGLAVKMLDLTHLQLSWTDNSNNEHGFEVQVEQDGNWVTAATAPANTPLYLAGGLPSYTHFTYRVRAANDAGNSDWSNEAGADTGVHAQVGLNPAAAIDFGTLAAGTPSAAKSVTITNNGNGPLTLSSLSFTGSNAGEFALVPTTATPRAVAPGESLSLGLVFTPAGDGPRSATLVIASNADGAPTTVALTGHGLVPVLRLIPTTLDFGEQPVGLNGSLAVLLQNTGDAPLHVSGLAIQGADAAEFTLAPGGWTGGTLQPGEISLLNVRFTPALTGARNASLAITDDAAGSPQSITLTGTGTAPLLRVSADSLVFALQAPGATQTVSFTNHGDAPLAIQSVALGGPDAGSFKILSDTGEASLAPGASRTLTVRFNPASVAAARRAHTAAARIAGAGYSATLEIRDNDPRPTSPHQIALVALAPPGAPGNLTATVVAGPQIQLTWSNPQPDPHAYLTVWRQEGTGSWTRVALLPGDATSFTDATVSGNGSYTYQAHWVNGPVVSPWSNLAHASTTGAVLAPPSGLTATVGSGPRVNLTWSVPAPNPHAYLTVWRQAAGGDWTRVALLRGDATRFTDATVQPGTSYTYHAHLVTDAAVSAWSNTATVSTPSAGPAQLTATAGPGGKVTLTWRNPHPDARAWVTVWRQAGTGEWIRVALLHGDAARFTDTQVSAGVSYRYRAHRVDGADVSDWSNEAAVVLPGAAAP